MVTKTQSGGNSNMTRGIERQEASTAQPTPCVWQRLDRARQRYDFWSKVHLSANLDLLDIGGATTLCGREVGSAAAHLGVLQTVTGTRAEELGPHCLLCYRIAGILPRRPSKPTLLWGKPLKLSSLKR